MSDTLQSIFMSNILFKKRTLSWLFLLLFCVMQTSSFAQNKEEVVIPGLYAMPEKAEQGQKTAVIKKAAVREDMHRFMGYEILPVRYLSLPFDVFMKNNVGAFFVDVGFLLLMLFPILFLFPKRDISIKKRGLLTVAVIGLCSLLMIISVSSAFLNQNNLTDPDVGLSLLAAKTSDGILAGISDAVNNIALHAYAPIYPLISSFSGESDSITYPILVFLFLGLIFLVHTRIKTHSRETKSILFLILMYAFLWWILGSGAAWYGILLFCVPYIFLIKGMSNQEEQGNNWDFKNLSGLAKRSNLLLLFTVAWMFLAFTHRAANYNPIDAERTKHIYIPPITEYQIGNISKEQLLNSSFPSVVEIEKLLNKNENSLVYRVGTQMKFFITKNDRRVVDDTFLDLFEQMIQRFKNKQKVIEALKISGVEYIILDLALAHNDQTPDKSLTRKFTNFLNTLYNNPSVEMSLTNRKIKLNNTDEEIFHVFQDRGTITQQGNFAVFRIK